MNNLFSLLDDLDLTPECYNEVDKKMKELLGDSYNVDTGNELQNSKLLFLSAIKSKYILNLSLQR